MAKAPGWTIAVRPDTASQARKITKIMPLSDGGFAVLTPYHQSKRGHLFKMPVDPSQMGKYKVSTRECINFTSNDKVKLSYHIDGFAQFSSQNNGNITSGIDPITKLPKGIGLHTHPLVTPISSGASVGMILWGIDSFDKATEKDNTIIFEAGDFYFRDCDHSTANSWQISIYALPKTSVPAIKIRNGRKYFTVNTERLSGPLFCMVEMMLLELGSNSPVNLAIYGNRMVTNFGTESGWTLNGPGNFTANRVGHVLMARYPLLPNDTLNAPSLDRPAPDTTQ